MFVYENVLYMLDYLADRANGRERHLRIRNTPRLPCGTRAAAARHRRAKEPLCEPCKQAEQEYQRAR